MNEGDAERARRALQLFRELCDLDRTAREERLAALRVDHSDLERDVRGLLDEDDAPSPALGAEAARANHARLASAFEEARREDQGFLPERIGGFRIVRRIGAGGMGVVFEARQSEPDRRVALKVVHPDLASPSRLERLEREVALLARLEHPGIARVYASGVDDLGRGPQPYFAMQLVEGFDLLRYCDERAFDVRARVSIVARVCEAVRHAHERGVVHRDLKPENVLVDGTGQPVVLDFGVARSVATSDLAQPALTAQGLLVGTLRYMSPEQAAGGRAVDARSDVYSLGVVLFELLSGRTPHALDGLSIAEAVRELSNTDPVRLAAAVPQLRGDLDAITSRALDPRPDRRYADAGELGADLERYLADQPVLARPHGRIYLLSRLARRNRALFAGASAALLALVGGTIVSIAFALRAIENQRETERFAYRGLIEAASASLDRARPERAIELLATIPEEARGWEWRHLESRAWGDSIPLESAIGLSGPIAYDASLELLCGPGVGELIVWRSDDGRLVRRIPFPDELSCLAPDVEDGVLIAGTANGRLLWIDVGSGAVERSLRLPSDAVAVDLSGGGRRPLLVGTDDRAFVVEDGALRELHREPDGRRLEDVEIHPIALIYLASSLARGDSAAQFRSQGRVRVYELESGREVGQRSPSGVGLFRSPRFDADGARLALGGRYGMSGIVSTSDLADVRMFGDHTGTVVSLDWSEDGRRLASLSRSGRLCIRDAQAGTITGVRIVPVVPEAKSVGTCRFLTDRTVLTSRAGAAELWPLEDPGSRVLEGHDGFVYNLRFLEDERTLITRTFDGDLAVWDVPENRRLASLDTGPGIGRFTVVGETLRVRRQRAVLEIDLATLDQVGATPQGEERTTDWRRKPTGADIALDPSGAFVAFAARGTVVDASTDEVLFEIDKPRITAAGVSFHPSHPLVLFANERITAHSLPDGELLFSLPTPPGGAYCAAFSPDGARLAVGGADGSIGLWDPENQMLITTLDGHTNYVRALDWSPDGTLLASASGDGTVRLWDSLPRSHRSEQVRAWRSEKDAVRAEVEAALDRSSSRSDSSAVVRAAFPENDPRRTAALRVLLELTTSD